MRKYLIILPALFLAGAGWAQQNYWEPVNEKDVPRELFTDKVRPAEYKLFRFKQPEFKNFVKDAPSEKVVPAKNSSTQIAVPLYDGLLEQFTIVEAPVMEPELAAKYPGLKSYAGIGVADPSRVIRFSLSLIGFYGMIMSPHHATVYISPLDQQEGYYLVASRDNMSNYKTVFECLTKNAAMDKSIMPDKNADDSKLRTFRLALAASGEFSQIWLDGTEPDDAARKAKVLAAQQALITRCNGIFEKDFSLRLLLVSNNTDIIYLNPATDPWPGSGLNSQTQTTIDAVIGDANYDIGHVVLGTGGGGNAGCIGCVCNSGSKGSGYTNLGGNEWKNDLFVVDYLPHEIGHQLGGNHTFTHGDEGPSLAQVEPGSGTTIMGYAGITGPFDVAAHSHDNFHAISIKQITDNIKAKSCPVVTNNGNTVPSANAGADYTIPRSTPFILTGSGSDPDEGDVVNYCWEQMDVATLSRIATFPNSADVAGPEFRCFSPTAVPSRTFPAIASILNGTNGSTWEVLPSVSRSLNFRFTVRDNHPGSGQNNSDDMVITVDGTRGPFAVTAPNTATTWCPGSRTVTWSVNGSDALAANVNIKLSYDGGNTFPVTLAAGTPNDGTQAVNIPCTYSTQARIKVEAVGNVFFDISNANFTVGDNAKPTFTAPSNQIIYKDASCNYNAATSITGDVTDEADNCDNTLDATYADGTAPGSCVGETILTRTWTLTDDCGNSTTKVQTITIRDNTPPTFTDPNDITIYKDANCNHDASTGVTGDVTDEADNCDNTLNATYTDVTAAGTCIGEEIITRTWSLTDDCGNNTSKTQVITVRDTTRPSITNVSANPNMLWPPNHRMKDVTINYTAVDNCSPVTNELSVTSNEPINGTGDGDTDPDWVVVDDHHVKLRAERAGNGNGRVYTIRITSTDDCGNVATTTTTVLVPHSNNGNLITMAPPEVIDQGLSVKALPNPTTRSFAVTISSDNQKDRIQVTVFDVYGRRVEEKWLNGGTTINLGDTYRAGTYMLRVIQGMEKREFKLVKLN